MKTVTINQVVEWNPCANYTREIIEKLFAGRESLSAWDIIDLDIPVEDRLWAVLRDYFFDEKTLRLIACDFAESILHFYERKYPNDSRPRDAINAAREYAKEQTKENKNKMVAARDAAWSAAWSAVWSAARSAARDAAWSAAEAAARYAAGSAVRAAAGDAEREKQISIVRKYLRAAE